MALFAEPQGFEFRIHQGSNFTLVFPQYLDLDTGEPFAFLTDNDNQTADWIGRLNIATADGTVVATCSSVTAETPDGTVAFDDEGHVTVELDSAFTGTLAYTLATNGTALDRLHADLDLVDPVDGETYTDYRGSGHVIQEVTTP
jgi:hypothetical protein